MSIETLKLQQIQKIAEEQYLLLHPETEADVVLLASETIEAETVAEALELLDQAIKDIQSKAVTGIKGEAEEGDFRTGNVTITKANLGLGNVENTSDAKKPISEAAQKALDLKADKTEIPDVSEFITKTVSDLANYYNKQEVDQKISSIPKFKVSVVDVLPESGDATTIYLLKLSKEESQNMYAEYIWVNEAWEKLGEQKLDLSGYVTTAALNAAIADFATEEKVSQLIATALTPYIKKTEVSALGKSGNLSDAAEDETHRLVTDTEKTKWDQAATDVDNIKSGETKVGSATSADTATKLGAEKKFSLKGDATGEATFDGSADAEIPVVLSETGVVAGSYSAVKVDKKGRVSEGGQVIEVGKVGQAEPSSSLVIGGLFFKRL